RGGQRAGGGRAGDQRGDHPQRIGGGERDGALGDEGGAEHPGGLAVLPLGLGERALAQHGGQGQAQRRGPAGGHHRRHHGELRLVPRGGGADRGQPGG